jgi:hypothetical protein
MTQGKPATPAPGPLEDCIHNFDELFAKLKQREAVRH